MQSASKDPAPKELRGPRKDDARNSMDNAHQMKKSYSNDWLLSSSHNQQGQSQGGDQGKGRKRGSRMSVDFNQLAQNEDVEVFYCNTVSPTTANVTAASNSQHKGREIVEEDVVEDSFYINVKH